MRLYLHNLSPSHSNMNQVEPIELWEVLQFEKYKTLDIKEKTKFKRKSLKLELCTIPLSL